MQYIGNKQSLVERIENIMKKNGVEGESFIDVFAGTHSVGKYFKEKGYTVYANDWQSYSYVIGKALIENNTYPLFEGIRKDATFHNFAEHQQNNGSNLKKEYEVVLDYLNQLEGIEGLFYHNYCLGGTKGKEFERLYFTDENGKKFDAIRSKIEEWKEKLYITENEFYILLYGLILATDKVSNTTSVYGAFLKSFKGSSLKTLHLSPISICAKGKKHRVYKEDAVKLAQMIEADIAYLDPPYNTRQYSSNYHVVETMALYDNPIIKGKTGLRNYEHQKSGFSSKTKVKQSFSDLVQHLQVKYIVFSYNNEGILSHEDIMGILSKKGETIVEEIDYKRFRSDKDRENRNYKADRVKELVYITKVQ